MLNLCPYSQSSHFIPRQYLNEEVANNRKCVQQRMRLKEMASRALCACSYEVTCWHCVQWEHIINFGSFRLISARSSLIKDTVPSVPVHVPSCIFFSSICMLNGVHFQTLWCIWKGDIPSDQCADCSWEVPEGVELGQKEKALLSRDLTGPLEQSSFVEVPDSGCNSLFFCQLRF